MQPGERVDIVKRVAERLAAEDGWTEIDLILGQFGFPTSPSWSGSKKSYLINHLKRGESDKLNAIDQYLMGHSRPGEDPWEDSAFRLFLTHVAAEKQTAHALKSCLRFFGIDAFVAHEDIDPGKEWQIVIESALNSCDALVGLLHEGFRESDWCDQEVGIALGQGIVVVPIQFDLLPYGFFGSVQAIPNGASREPKNLASELVQILAKDKRTAIKLTDVIVNTLANATSYDQANELSRLLAEDTPLLSENQAESLRRAEKENSQLMGAWRFDQHLSKIESMIGVVHAAPNGPRIEEEPF